MRKVPKQKFTQEFRQEVVRLVLEQSFSTIEAARRLEMSVKTLSGWVVTAKEGQLEKIDTQRKEPVSSLEPIQYLFHPFATTKPERLN